MICGAVYQIGVEKVRIIHIDADSKKVALYPLGPKNDPVVMFFHEFNDKKPILVADPMSAALGRLLSPTKAEKKHKERAHRIVEEAQGHIMELIMPGRRYARLLSLAELFGTTRQTVIKYLRKWWNGGMKSDALLPDFHKCGNVAPGKTPVTARGARPRFTERNVYVVTEKDKRVMDVCLRRYYLGRPHRSLSETYDKMVERYYSVRDDDGKEGNLPLGQRPSVRQLEYYLHRHVTLERRLIAQYGDNDYVSNKKPKLGDVLQGCFGPGHMYELDSTQDNTHIVARFDRYRKIGRVTVYFIKDRYSRAIVGFYVTLDPPSWSGAVAALVSLVEDREALCKKYGIPYDPLEWPIQGIPEYIVVDRAEGISYASDRLVKEVGVGIKSVKAHHGERKPVIENNHKLYQKKISCEIPGYKAPRLNKRGPKSHEEQEAAMDFDQIVGAIVRVVRTINTSRVRGYPLTSGMIADGVRPIPVELMRWGIANAMGRLRICTPEELMLKVLPRSEATVTPDGIKVKQCFYSCEQAVREQWFNHAARRSWRISVIYDPRCVDRVFLVDPKANRGYHVLELLPKSRAYAGLSFSEAEADYTIKRGLEEEAEEITRQRSGDLNRDLSATAKTSKHATQVAIGDKPLSGRRKDDLDARKTECTANHQAEAFNPNRNTKSAEPSAAPSTQKVVPLRSDADVQPKTVSPTSPEGIMQNRLERILNGNHMG